MYYRGANAAILVYDITSASSFDDVKVWIDGMSRMSPGAPGGLSDKLFFGSTPLVSLVTRLRGLSDCS